VKFDDDGIYVCGIDGGDAIPKVGNKLGGIMRNSIALLVAFVVGMGAITVLPSKAQTAKAEKPAAKKATKGDCLNAARDKYGRTGTPAVVHAAVERCLKNGIGAI
jgi:hypothetical protein